VGKRVVVGVIVLLLAGGLWAVTQVAGGGGSEPPSKEIAFRGLSKAAGPGSKLEVPAPRAKEGDFLLAVIFGAGTQADQQGRTIIEPEGWTHIEADLHATWSWRPFESGDEGSSWTWVAEDGETHDWNGSIFAYSGVDLSDPLVDATADRACSADGDGVCDQRPGTPGEIIAPSAETAPGSWINAWYTSHERGDNVLTLPEGFVVRYTYMLERRQTTIAGDSPAESGDETGPLVSTTSKAEFVHGIAGLVVMRPG
jgi:hypothetical protein